MSVEVRGMKADELEDALEFVPSIMGGTREFFEAAWRLAPGALPEHSRLVVADGRIASHQHLYFRQMSLGSVTVKAGQIGDVCTHPDFRHRGYGTMLLDDAREYFRGAGVPFSMISSGLFGFYYHGGYQSYPLKRYVVDLAKAPARKTDPGRYFIRRAMRELDLPDVAACYDDYNRNRPFSVIRTPDYWKKQFWTRRGETEDGFLVAEHDGKAVGYVRMCRDMMLEAGYIAGHGETLPPLFDAALSLARKRGLETLTLHLPEDEPFIERIREFAKEEEYLTILVKVVDIGMLLSEVAKGLSTRLEEKMLRELDGWKLGVRLDKEEAGLVFAADGVKAVEGIPEDAADVFEYDHAGLVAMLTGGFSQAEGEAAERLKKAFGGKAPHFWPQDTV